MDLTEDDIIEYNGLVTAWNAERSALNGQALVDFLNEHKGETDPAYTLDSVTTLSINQASS